MTSAMTVKAAEMTITEWNKLIITHFLIANKSYHTYTADRDSLTHRQS
jgi:hypothetical protein